MGCAAANARNRNIKGTVAMISVVFYTEIFFIRGMHAAKQPPSREHPLLSGLPHVWDDMASHIHTRQVEKDTPLYHQGDDATTLWLVLSGWVKLTRHTPDGKESIVGLCAKGDIFGEASLSPNVQYFYTACTVGSGAMLALMPADLLRRKIADAPELSQRIMSLLNARTAQAYLQLEHRTTLSAAQRLGCFLLRLCNAPEDEPLKLHIPIEKHVLATYLGMQPETFSRSLQQLKAAEVEVHGNDFIVHQIDALRDFVCGSCSQSGGCTPNGN